MRLIDADALKAQFTEWDHEQRPWMTEGYHMGVKDCAALTDAAPTIEPGRCGACALRLIRVRLLPLPVVLHCALTIYDW